MFRLEIGKPYPGDRTSWPDGWFGLAYANGHTILALAEERPSLASIERFRRGPMHFALHYEQGVIFFLFRIEGAWDWSDNAFSIHLVPPEARGSGDNPGTHYAPVTVAMIEAGTGLVVALRVATMSPRLVRQLRTYIDHQLVRPFSAQAHQAAIEEVYRRYPHPKALAQAAVFRERAGSNNVPG